MVFCKASKKRNTKPIVNESFRKERIYQKKSLCLPYIFLLTLLKKKSAKAFADNGLSYD